MKLKIIDVAGLKKSGKTTVVENLVAGLKKHGYKVGTIKKIHIPKFSIDQEGKDTCRHRSAGADFVISLAPSEIALLKDNYGSRGLNEVIDLIPEDTDILVCEELNEVRDEILYILTLKELADFEETIRVRSVGKKIIAISGVVSNSVNKYKDYQVLNTTTKDGLTELLDLIMNH